jgi:hypothetical protein
MNKVELYEGGPPSEEDSGPVTFELELHEGIFTSKGLTCRLIRNHEPVGMIHVSSMQEFIWLKQRVNGAFDPESTGT